MNVIDGADIGMVYRGSGGLGFALKAGQRLWSRPTWTFFKQSTKLPTVVRSCHSSVPARRSMNRYELQKRRLLGSLE